MSGDHLGLVQARPALPCAQAASPLSPPEGRTDSLSLSPHPFIPARRRAEVRARLRECDRSLSDKGSDASRMSGACVRRAPRRAAPELLLIKVFISFLFNLYPFTHERVSCWADKCSAICGRINSPVTRGVLCKVLTPPLVGQIPLRFTLWTQIVENYTEWQRSSHRTRAERRGGDEREAEKDILYLQTLAEDGRRQLKRWEIRPPVEGRDLDAFNEERGSQARRLRPQLHFWRLISMLTAHSVRR
ncbi:hypothetical protein E1301_Tti009536 [Triplophysa tibetana]|uniref:Uncharacterized protein n=1 Tax=Triplophysa tibetana TaxID=1572043 RepID=A0A5A9NFY0_9TELE|nr:hypothetical protein E1301_Tti009536 [Triplophysa tibetana]